MIRFLHTPGIVRAALVAACDGRPTARGFFSAARQKEQHLLWAGTILDKTAPVHKALDQDLFIAAGAADDIARGDLSLLDIAASPTPGHSLIAYRTAAPEKLSRVLSVGRNTYAQLGVGFASQEATFGLLHPGFEGVGGIAALAAGSAQTWLLTKDERGVTSRLFACGNNTLGQLGRPLQLHQPPQLDIFPNLRPVDFGRNWTVTSFAVGLDHALLVKHRNEIDGSRAAVEICSTGLNTDGQLGRRTGGASTPMSSYLSPSCDGAFRAVVVKSTQNSTIGIAPVFCVAAGGDTSFVWSKSPDGPSRVWAWGNNEYSQCLLTASREAGEAEQLTFPTEVTDNIASLLNRQLVIEEIKLGGSWTVILDDAGTVYIAGLGVSGDMRKITKLTEMDGLPPIASLSVSNDAVMAISQCRRRLFAWGINANGGVLGLDSSSCADGASGAPEEAGGLRVDSSARETIDRFARPKEIKLGHWLGESGTIQQVSLGGDQSWILLEDGQEPKGVWRGSQPHELV